MALGKPSLRLHFLVCEMGRIPTNPTDEVNCAVLGGMRRDFTLKFLTSHPGEQRQGVM